jgi:uncharacterized protein (TIGR02646 family)
MLKVECLPLPDTLQSFLEQKRKRNAPWRSLNESRPARAIKAALREAFHDKCGYCEQIEAQTVDHFVPQSTPESRWSWDNYVLACDVCQSRKHDKPPFDDQGRQMVNPRHDDPIRFLHFVFDTGMVTPRPDSDETFGRGRITIRLLDFDRRTRLQDERRRRLLDILGFALRVVQPISAGDAEDAWRQLGDHLSATAPYLGMVRQLFLTQNDFTPVVTALREARPEIDEIIAQWCHPLGGK